MTTPVTFIVGPATNFSLYPYRDDVVVADIERGSLVVYAIDS